MKRKAECTGTRKLKNNEMQTLKRVEQYHGKLAIAATWKLETKERQAREHAYLIDLARRVRTIKNYIVNRADARAEV